MRPDRRGEHLRVRGADDGAVRVPEVVELRLAERDADRFEVARDVARADLARVRAHALRAPGGELRVVLRAATSSVLGGRRAPAARPAPRSRNASSTQSIGREAPVPRGSKLTTSKRSLHDVGQPRTTRGAGSRRPTGPGRRSSRPATPMRCVGRRSPGGGSSASRTVSPSAVVQSTGTVRVPHCEAVAAVGPRDGGVERGQRRPGRGGGGGSCVGARRLGFAARDAGAAIDSATRSEHAEHDGDASRRSRRVRPRPTLPVARTPRASRSVVATTRARARSARRRSAAASTDASRSSTRRTGAARRARRRACGPSRGAPRRRPRRWRYGSPGTSGSPSVGVGVARASRTAAASLPYRPTRWSSLGGVAGRRRRCPTSRRCFVGDGGASSPSTPHGGVDRVGGHAPVGGELAAGDGDHAARRHPHRVPARQVGGAGAASRRRAAVGARPTCPTTSALVAAHRR